MVLEELASLAGKITAQQELLHMIDALVDAGAQVIATCREPLARANWLIAGLAQPLAGGLGSAAGLAGSRGPNGDRRGIGRGAPHAHYQGGSRGTWLKEFQAAYRTCSAP